MANTSKSIQSGIFLSLGLVCISMTGCVQQGFGLQEDQLSLASAIGGEFSPGTPTANLYAEGKVLYTNNCAACHGALNVSNRRGSSAVQIRAAISTVPNMLFFQTRTSEEISKIAYVLNNAEPSSPITSTPGGGVVTPPLPANTSFTCVANSDPGISPTRRLTKTEYGNTLITLFGDGELLGRYDRVWDWFPFVGSISPILATVPEDDNTNQFSRLDHVVSSGLLEGQFMVAQAFSKAVAQSSKIRNYAGTCAEDTAPTVTCVNNFIASFGKRAFRRPVKADEAISLKLIYDQFAVGSPRDGFEAVFESMLMSPQFLFLMETEGTPVPGKPGVLKLTDYELASRLSYRLVQDMPTAELFAAADAGTLSTDSAVYNTIVDKLMDTPNNLGLGISQRTHPLMMSPFERTVMGFYEEWLKVNNLPLPAATAAVGALQGIYGPDLNKINWHDLGDGNYQVIVMEARDFLFRMTFLENKKYADVLMDNSAVLQNVEASHFYNLPDGTPLDQIIQLPGRAGILTRAPFLGTGTETTSPIRRGAFIRRQILCDTLSSPDPDKLPDRSLSAPVADPTQAQTTRERYAAKTASNECMQCHSKINSLGFAFEDFDSLGRNRSTLGEPVFQVNGDSVTLVKMLPVNASVASIDINNGDNIPVNGGIQLMNTLAASEKANTCFVRQVYRYTGGRIEDGGDDCQMKAMYDEMGKDGGSIMGLLKALPRQPNFRLRKVGI